MKAIKGLFLSTLFALTSAQAGTLDFSAAGFKIDSLDVEPRAGSDIRALQMWLPEKNGISANVNVHVQPFDGSMAQYVVLSLGQLEQLGTTIVSRRQEGDTVVFEYKGNIRGQNFHWYAKAVKHLEHVYLVTATDSQQNWDSHKQQLMSVVNSFELK